MPGMARDGRQDRRTRSRARALGSTDGARQHPSPRGSAGAARPDRDAIVRAASAPIAPPRPPGSFDANGDGVIENWSFAHGGDSFANFTRRPSGSFGTDVTPPPTRTDDAARRPGDPRPPGRSHDRAPEHAGHRPPRRTPPTSTTVTAFVGSDQSAPVVPATAAPTPIVQPAGLLSNASSTEAGLVESAPASG